LGLRIECNDHMLWHTPRFWVQFYYRPKDQK
jgi:hypothetical protein